MRFPSDLRIWMRFTFCLSLTVSGMLAVTAAPLAQVPASQLEQSENPQLNERETLENLSEFFGVPPKSRFYKSFAAEFGNDLRHAAREMRRRGKDQPDSHADNEENEVSYDESSVQESSRQGRLPADESQSAPADLPVIKHYRASYGVNLPKREEVYNPLKMDREEIKEKLKEYMAEAEPVLRSAYTAQPLPACAETKTDRQELSSETAAKGDKEKLAKVIMDVLFLTQDQLPLSKTNVFGEKTKVHVYKPGTQDKASVLAQASGVPCLPYRVRITRKFRHTHYGLDALKNYDKNQHGKGFLQDSMKSWEQVLKTGGYDAK